jgi:hypothetical protein
VDRLIVASSPDGIMVALAGLKAIVVALQWQLPIGPQNIVLQILLEELVTKSTKRAL